MHDDDDGHMAAWDDGSGGCTVSEASGRVLGVLGVLGALGVMAIVAGLVALAIAGWGRP